MSCGSRGTHGRPSSQELLHARGQAASPGAGPHSARVRGEAGLPAGWQPPPLPTPAHPEKLPELLGGQSLGVWRRLALSCQKSSFSFSLAVPSSSDFLARGPSWIKDSLGGGQQDSALVVRKLCKGGLQLGGRRGQAGPESGTALSSRLGRLSHQRRRKRGEDQERGEEAGPVSGEWGGFPACLQ